MSDKISRNIQYCPCGSKKNINECCLIFISGRGFTLSAELLMRSRYTAYALGEVRYITDTWHSSTRPVNLMLEESVVWTGLQVLASTIEKNNEAYVEFIAAFNNAGVMGQMHERSRFLFEEGSWFYVDGEQLESETQYNAKKPGRNELCYCGSGRKFKKCCGKN